MPRGGTNYMPRPDGDFNSWALNFWAAVDNLSGAHPLPPAQVAAVETALNVWAQAYANANNLRALAEAATAAKTGARAALEAAVRPMAVSIHAIPGITDADKLSAGLKLHDTSKTPAPVPTSAPLVRVESGQRLTHRVRFIDAAAPTSRGKPPGTSGAQVWRALAPANEPPPPPGSSYSFLEVSSRGSAQATYPSAAAGQTAHYILRWMSTRGEPGPWSEVASATVAA